MSYIIILTVQNTDADWIDTQPAHILLYMMFGSIVALGIIMVIWHYVRQYIKEKRNPPEKRVTKKLTYPPNGKAYMKKEVLHKVLRAHGVQSYDFGKVVAISYNKDNDEFTAKVEYCPGDRYSTAKREKK